MREILPSYLVKNPLSGPTLFFLSLSVIRNHVSSLSSGVGLEFPYAISIWIVIGPNKSINTMLMVPFSTIILC